MVNLGVAGQVSVEYGTHIKGYEINEILWLVLQDARSSSGFTFLFSFGGYCSTTMGWGDFLLVLPILKCYTGSFLVWVKPLNGLGVVPVPLLFILHVDLPVPTLHCAHHSGLKYLSGDQAVASRLMKRSCDWGSGNESIVYLPGCLGGLSWKKKSQLYCCSIVLFS